MSDRRPDRTGTPLLEVRDLTVRFHTRSGTVTAVDRLTFSVEAGQVLGVVGESGSGKSVTCLALLRLLDAPGAEVSGEVIFRGRDLLHLGEREMRSVRGREIAMIFSDHAAALTPVYPVGWHLTEQIRAHERMSRAAARARAVQLLGEVGIPDPERRVDAYPHQLSGGMRQRVGIAMALVHNPALLVADEPTTALDVTIQAQILDLMQRLRHDHGSSIVLVTHDLGVVAQLADRVLVMYGGRIAEAGSCRAVLRRPQHPYTWGLLRSIPAVGGGRLDPIPGTPISSGDRVAGCRFAPRCRFAFDACSQQPALLRRGGSFDIEPTGDHLDACWLPLERRIQEYPPSRP